MTIFYHDVSHFQGAYVPTGPTCAKATEGATYTDLSYAAIRAATLARGWPFLPYHFLRPHTISSIASQVSHVVHVVGRRSIMLDVEKEPLDSLAEQRELVQDMLAFADQYHAVGGRVTLAYFPRWEQQAIGSPSLTGLTSRGIGLVSSNYTTYSDSGPGWNAYGGVRPIIWQYTSTPLDTNAFKGTQAALADLWAHGINNSDPSVPVQPPEPDVNLTDKLSNGMTVDDAIVRAATTLQQPIGGTGYNGTAGQPNTLAQWIQTGLGVTLPPKVVAALADVQVPPGIDLDALGAAVASHIDLDALAGKVDALIAARYAS